MSWKMGETTVSIGGVFRCCIASVPHQKDPEDEVNVGDTVFCSHCGEEFELTETMYGRGQWKPVWILEQGGR